MSGAREPLRLALSPWSWRPTSVVEAADVLRSAKRPSKKKAVRVVVADLGLELELPLDADGAAAAIALANGSDPLAAAQAGPSHREQLVELKLRRDREIRHLRLPAPVRDGVLAELERIAIRRAGS